jgi:hypothetical protein
MNKRIQHTIELEKFLKADRAIVLKIFIYKDCRATSDAVVKIFDIKLNTTSRQNFMIKFSLSIKKNYKL